MSSAATAKLLDIARTLNAARDYAETIALTDDLKPGSIPTPLAAARVKALTAMNRAGDAMALIEAAARSGDARPLCLAAAEAAGEDRDWPLALRLLDRGAKEGVDARFAFRRGVALFHLGRLDESLEALDEASQEAILFEPAFNLTIRILKRQRRTESLIQACETLLTRHPANEGALMRLVREHLAAKRFAEARLWFARGRAVSPTSFPWDLFDVLALERERRLSALEEAYHERANEDAFSEDLRARIASLLCDGGDFLGATAFADRLRDAGDRHSIRLKIQLARGATAPEADLAGAAATREGRVGRALDFYRSGDFNSCLGELGRIVGRPHDRLPLRNFANLAKAGRVLSHEMFARAAERAPADGPLPTIRQLWIGGPLSKIERLSIRSFLACGHPVHLYAYDPELEVPSGCQLEDARQILPEETVFAHSERAGRNQGSLAGFADIFRWKLIHEKGGAWADCDVVCLRPIRERRIIATELVRLAGVVVPAVTNCLFVADAGETAFARAFEDSRRIGGEALLWGEAGVHKMAELVVEEGWADRLTAPTDICPIPPFRMRDAIDGAFDVEAVLRHTACRAVHLYNEGMRDGGLDKDAPPPRGGLVDLLIRGVAARELGVEWSGPPAEPARDQSASVG